MPVENLSKTPVTEIMDTDFPMVRPDTTLSEAIGIMLKHKEFELPVIAQNGVLKGMLSYVAIARAGRVTMNAKVETLQLTVPKLTVTDDVRRAAELLLASDHRTLPVTRNRKVQGIVRRRKIIELTRDAETWKTMKVTDLMHKPVEVVSVDDRLTRARNMMREYDIRTIPVVDREGFLVGVIGVQDIVAFLRPRRRKHFGDFSGEKVSFDPLMSEVMVENPKFVLEDAPMSSVIDMMLDGNISTVLVVRERRPVGVVSRFDIVEYIVSAGRKQKGVFVNISGLEGEDPDVLDAVFDILDNAMNKVNKIYTPQVLNIHVRKYKEEGNEIKYSIDMRLSTSKGLFISKSVDWDVFRAFSQGTDILYAQIVRKKDQVKDYKPPNLRRV